MVFHVVHATEEPAAFLAIRPFPLTFDAWIVLGLMPCTILLGRKATCDGQFGGITDFRACLDRLLLCYRYTGSLRLRTTIHSAEEVL